MPIKVVHIMPQIGMGGAEKQLFELITHSDPAIVVHKVLYYSDAGHDDCLELYSKEGIDFQKVQRNGRRSLKFLSNLVSAIKSAKPDIVHCWLYSANVWGRWAALLAGIKCVIVAYRNCELLNAPLLRILEFPTKNKVHHLANSKAVARFVGKKIGVSPDKFKIIYNGFELEKFNVNSDKVQMFGHLGIQQDDFVVTMVGRLVKQKNYHMLIRMAKQMFATRGVKVRFLIVGGGYKEHELKQFAEKLGVSHMINFLSIRNDVNNILAASDAFCFTTLFEGFPNALLEAMAAGLPVITTDFDGVRELVYDHTFGSIVPVDDVDAACKALNKFIDNRDFSNQMGMKAKQYVFQQFSVEKMTENTLDFYKEIFK